MNIRYLLTACCIFLVMQGNVVMAEELVPAVPTAAQLSPQGGLIHVRQTLPLQKDSSGQAFCVFVLPAGAENFNLAPTSPVLRTQTEHVAIQNNGSGSHLATEIERRIAECEGQLASVKTSVALWENHPTTITFQDLTQQIASVQENLPALIQKRTQLEKELGSLKEQLGTIEKAPNLGQRVTAWLETGTKGAETTLEYTYTLQACGWQPWYVFDAQPGPQRGADAILVRLYANIWQFSGIDWENTKLALITQATGPREPANLPRWSVEAREQTKNRETAMPMMVAESAVQDTVGTKRAMQTVANADIQAHFAKFELEGKGLKEGRMSVCMATDTWKAPLVWLARPVRGNTGVWLMADCELPTNTTWPTGKATFYVEGQNAGDGSFHPSGHEVKLFFGADPRVTLDITGDVKNRGESGFIGKEKHWNWGWTYNLTNRHPYDVKVRIERPLPQIVNDKVTLKHNDTPEAVKDEKKHLMFWEVAVPANGNASVRHGIGLSAPADMPLYPVAP